MKNTLLLPLLFFLIGCTSDSKPEDGLPKETQTGANTFGCLIDGKLYKPRCEEPSVVFPQWGMTMWGGIPNVTDYSEIEVRDLKSEKYFEMLIHIDELHLNSVGEFIIDESNGENSVDGLNHTYLHCIVYDKKTNNYKKYISYENSGSIIITMYRPGSNVPLTGAIISGSFSGKLRNINDSSEEIEITKGRFDVNSLTCSYKEFP
jgi:hypothetical protein